LARSKEHWQNTSVNLAQSAQLVFAVAAASGVFSFVRTAQDGDLRSRCTSLCEIQPQYAGRNRLAPGFELPRMRGGHARMSDYAGKTLVMNFWTKNCGPCLDEMPSLAQFARTLSARNAAVFVSVCTDDSFDDVKQTLEKVLPDGAPFDILLDPDAKVVTELYGTKLYPETWFIDPKGIIRARIDGARDYDQPIYVNFVEGLTQNIGCGIEFKSGVPRGNDAWLCAK
jgi:thiol-disulfide isomerase/thioredoxin